jgi:O-glycosyl hydrolase
VGELPLAVEAELPEGAEGDLSYQWFSALTYTNKDGDRIDKTSATCTVDLNAPGTYYFYVAVTNTITKEVEVEVEEEVEVEIDGETTTQTVTKTETQTVTQIKTVTSHPATFKIVADLEANAGISIDPASKYQYVRGFGGMDIPWGNFFNIEMSEYRKMFTDEGLGYNMMRIMIMPGIPIPNSNEVENATLEETMDYYVNGEGNRPNYYEGVKLVNENGGYVLASPWSPPPRWKTNNSKNSHGRLFPVNYPDYAQYLKDFCQHMYDNGAPIYAVSIQNEPNYSGDYDGCEWSGAEMRDFFKRVGHFTDGVKGWGGGKEIPVVLTMNGESANHPNINDAAMDDSVSRAVIDIIGRHTYGNQQYRYAKALDVEPKKEVWMSEKNLNSAAAPAYPNDSTWNYVWQFMNDVDLSIRLNDESAYIWWALKRFYSFIGDGQYTTTEGTVLPRGYGLSHYAKYAKEMWRCAVSIQGVLGDGFTAISTSTATSNVNSSTNNQFGTDAKVNAFVSDDGNTFSLVMFTPTNTSGARGVDLGTVEINMPEGFVPSTVTAMRSNASVKAKTEDVLLSADKKKAYVMLPPGSIVSVKFTR